MEDETTNEQSATSETEETQPQTESEETPQKSGVEKRISELTRKRREAERDAAYWKGRAEAVQQKIPEKAPEKELDPKDFNSDADYLKAVAKKVADDTRAAIRAEKAVEAQSSVVQAVKDAREKYEDFDDVALVSDLTITSEMSDAALGENWGDILYHLGKNPKEAARIAKLPPIRQAKEIGKIETILSTKPSKKTTQAPDPPKVVAGNANSLRKKDTDMNRSELHAEWERQRRAAAGLK